MPSFNKREEERWPITIWIRTMVLFCAILFVVTLRYWCFADALQLKVSLGSLLISFIFPSMQALVCLPVYWLLERLQIGALFVDGNFEVVRGGQTAATFFGDFIHASIALYLGLDAFCFFIAPQLAVTTFQSLAPYWLAPLFGGLLFAVACLILKRVWSGRHAHSADDSAAADS